MASVKKFNHAAGVNILRHNNRTIKEPSNKDIDVKKNHLDYRLSPERDMDDYSYYLQRKNEVYCYGRSDVVTMAGWVITAPINLSKSEYSLFFEASYEFLKNRYGEENCVHAIVHNDESGLPHLHFCFMPVVPDKKHGGEKICANEVLTPKELRDFHPAFQSFLDSKGINASVHTGITAAQGGNRTVKDMKNARELDRTRTVQRDIDNNKTEKPKEINIGKPLQKKTLGLNNQSSRWKTLDQSDRSERSRW